MLSSLHGHGHGHGRVHGHRHAFKAFPLVMACLAAISVPACSSQHSGDGDAKPLHFRDLASRVRAERLCRKIVVDSPSELSPAAMRQSYGHCLRTLRDDPDARSSPSAPAPPSSSAIQPTPGAPPVASEPTAQERYLFCQLHREEIAAASRQYNQAVEAFGRVQSSDSGSEEYRKAASRLTEALQNLQGAIPLRFRQGRNLMPDVLREFQSCQRPG